ncbi:MAG TPA: hypothetical protein VNK03_07005 [Gammaproteobacteria bacterium]|nr:hypothetical protein [Gammaproteobacteria bacterium]
MPPKWSDLWKELTEKFQSIETAKSDLLHSNDLPDPEKESGSPTSKILITLQLDREKAKAKSKIGTFSEQILKLSENPEGGSKKRKLESDPPKKPKLNE